MKPKKKEIKIKCLQGQMKEGEKEIDCSSYPRGMKHEVLSHYQTGYMRGMSIGVDKAVEEYEAWEVDKPVDREALRDKLCQFKYGANWDYITPIESRNEVDAIIKFIKENKWNTKQIRKIRVNVDLRIT